MPINNVNPVEDLADSLKYWYEKTKRKVTYEYVIWDGINDDEIHARALAKFCKIIPSKVNIIQYNPIDEGEFRQASQEAVEMYVRILENQGIIAKVRKSRGQDIDAACGQLANKNEVGELGSID
jgi:23S rRNA (adenine2503-C2)-methyltransferase